MGFATEDGDMIDFRSLDPLAAHVAEIVGRFESLQ
jgi:hypothetical protein